MSTAPAVRKVEPRAAQPLLSVRDLRTYFHTPRGIAKAVDGVSFSVEAGKTLAIVGESGCGKSVTALSIIQLLAEPAGYVESGEVWFDGQDLLALSREQIRAYRGRRIGMVFQEPMTSLNPVFTIGRQVIEGMEVHGIARGKQAWSRAVELLDRVGIQEPAMVMNRYPHELSGGMRQRVMIAGALACSPDLLIADEPTTALDVTVQAQILALLAELQRELGMAMLLITHDLGIVAEMADDVAVMYAGQMVETAPARELYRAPQHPYTRALFASLPSRQSRGQDLMTIEGRVPDATAWPPGCRFADRCPERFEPCPTTPPQLAEVRPGHEARCLLHPECFPAAVPGEGSR
ncbi:MAG: ABC transporter ATP-binding protein [Armatimonadota bacterium]